VMGYPAKKRHPAVMASLPSMKLRAKMYSFIAPIVMGAVLSNYVFFPMNLFLEAV
jgi:hypothetical protein